MMYDDDDEFGATFFGDLKWILARALLDAARYVSAHSPRTLSNQEIRGLAAQYTWRAIDELTAGLDDFEFRGRTALLTDIIEKQRAMIEDDLESEEF